MPWLVLMAGRQAQSIEEIFPLINYCRQGRLEEARAWAESGKPLDPPPNARRNVRRVPLLIAIDQGFYSMAALLLEHGADPMCQTNALKYAIQRERPEIVRLLLESKQAVPDPVSFAEVCRYGNPGIISV
jgi:hypothetical protein